MHVTFIYPLSLFMKELCPNIHSTINESNLNLSLKSQRTQMYSICVIINYLRFNTSGVKAMPTKSMNPNSTEMGLIIDL